MAQATVAEKSDAAIPEMLRYNSLVEWIKVHEVGGGMDDSIETVALRRPARYQVHHERHNR